MTARDRLMLMGIAVVAVLGAVWLLAVSPERERAAKVSTEVAAARQELSNAEAQAHEATGAKTRYAADYSSLVTLGQAVPASTETPALIYTLEQASSSHDVKFSSIVDSSASSSSSGPASSSSSSSATQKAGLTQQPFTFVFEGNYVAMSRLLGGLESFTTLTSSGPLQVNGRLLTIDSVALSPASAVASQSGKPSSPTLTGTVTATAYVLPTGESTLGGASAAGPAGVPAAGGSSSSSSSGAGTPAVVKAP